jgi:shikimate dehydrogenase
MGARRGIPIVYVHYPVPPDDIDAWTLLWGSDLSGFNVTSPLKERAAESCTRLAPSAARIGAVNTVLRDGHDWVGHSTDGYGFARALLGAEEPIRGRTAAVLGTGGAGRAVACALAGEGAEVTVVTRSPARPVLGCEELPRVGWDALDDLGPFDIVVNATPIGRGVSDAAAPPLPYDRWCRRGLAVDLNYMPPVTAFLRAAHATGARTLNGFGMLIHQACLSAGLLLEGDPAAAESYEEDFWAVAREIAPQVSL